MTEISQDLLWWITVVDLPALAGLLLMIWRTKAEMGAEVKGLHYTLDLRSLETRLVEHLLRIEAKLDATALKAESLKSVIGHQ